MKCNNSSSITKSSDKNIDFSKKNIIPIEDFLRTADDCYKKTSCHTDIYKGDHSTNYAQKNRSSRNLSKSKTWTKSVNNILNTKTSQKITAQQCINGYDSIKTGQTLSTNMNSY